MSNAKLKVGFLLLQKQNGSGGLEKVLKDVVEGLQDEIESFVYFVEEPRDIRFLYSFERARCYRVPKLLRNKRPLRPKILYKYFLSRSTKRLGVTLLEDDLDVLLVLDLGKPLLKYLNFLNRIKALTNVKVLSWAHKSAHNLTINQIKAMAIFDHFLTISDGIATQIRNCGYDNVSVIYNPIEEASLIKRKINHFIYVGRIDKNKRVYELINIFSKIDRDNYVFDIYGSSGDKRKDKQLQHFIESKKLSNCINFHGWRSNPWSDINEAGVLLLNSKNEGFPLVLVEAMMRGITCLSSNCSTGPSDIIVPNVNGWLYGVDDEAALKSYLVKILSGELVLPEPEIIRKSVNKFRSNEVLSKFKALLFELSYYAE